MKSGAAALPPSTPHSPDSSFPSVEWGVGGMGSTQFLGSATAKLGVFYSSIALKAFSIKVVQSFLNNLVAQ
jgi:hypothetical protein